MLICYRCKYNTYFTIKKTLFICIKIEFVIYLQITPHQIAVMKKSVSTALFLLLLGGMIFNLIFMTKVNSQATLSMRNLEVLTQTESGGNQDRGLQICICADIYSPSGYYDFRYMKRHCHVRTGLGCQDEYPCNAYSGFSWVKCGSY